MKTKPPNDLGSSTKRPAQTDAQRRAVEAEAQRYTKAAERVSDAKAERVAAGLGK